MKYLDLNRNIKPSLYKFLKYHEDLIRTNQIEELYRKLKESGWNSCKDLTYVLSNKGKRNIFEYCEHEIPEAACSYDKGLYQIEIPDHIEEIRNSAFEGCDNLTQIILPESVDVIERWAFNDLPNLEEMVINGPLVTLTELSIMNTPKLDTIYSVESNKDLLYYSVKSLKDGFCRFLVI